MSNLRMEPHSPTKFLLYIAFAVFVSISILTLSRFEPEYYFPSSVEHIDETDSISFEKKEERKGQLNFKEEVVLEPISKEPFSIKKRTAVIKPDQSDEVTSKVAVEKRSKRKKAEVERKSGTSEEYFANLLEDYHSNLSDKLGTEEIRKDIIIRYYKHAPDGNKVYSLMGLGFYIHERPVASSQVDYESNAVFYGDNVSEDDLKLVVYKLLQQNMPIKLITKSQYHDSWKASSIEIGTDTTAIDKPIINFSQLRKLTL
ncbi:MAG: hypothetical protein JXR03_07405 [Cyclobacteriaceae bacterium]